MRHTSFSTTVVMLAGLTVIDLIIAAFASLVNAGDGTFRTGVSFEMQ